ncbi:uracil-DNA glycosylase [Sphingobacterium thalpophilum]|uniref:Uracil-DNA glycosylase n=1 Tax=Sphingobacterium thalpophilum TaxID=259 RepID=A0A4V6KT15_9SPHI|nr:MULTISPECIES: uracil-DNA glycosylase [Sphingobacterium]MCW8312564.1 uracil-DNA glycosylase [Sphingobacterium sp. InxBP1]VTR36888.1 Uracil-DNA glycosylase [Sphingobacterium thalpophilum]
MEKLYDDSWAPVLKPLFSQPYMKQLSAFVQEERRRTKVFPPAGLVMNAFKLTPLPDVKVVILGQDPYHNDGQAHGLSFSVPGGIALPPSLKNIFKELQDDIAGFTVPRSGDLSSWAKQGVLLLNATLTVQAHLAGSHQKKGWEMFTDSIIHAISERCEHVVFLLWGSYAQQKSALIDTRKHLVLKSVHPSPLSAHRGFFGSKHFSKANQYLKEHGKTPIDWRLS